MYFARKDPDAYYKLADLLKAKEINKSIETLQILKKNRPDLNVQKRMAEVYYTANDLTNAIAAYKSIGVDSLDDRELMQYSLSLYIKKDFSQSLDLAQKGHKRASKDPVFNRLLLYNNTELQHFDTAISNADDLFNNSKDTKPQYQDYIYYGYALSGLGKTQEAIQQFNVALQKNGDIPGIHKEISDAYSRIHDYDNAIKYYEQYVANLKDTTDNRAYNIFQLGRLYWRKGTNVKENETRTEDQTKAIEHSAELFGQVATLRPNSYLGFYWQAKANAMLDPEYTKGLAKPYYSKAAELLEKSGSSKDHLIECYKQLSYYYYINKEMNSSVEYAQKILELDPEDDFAKQMVALKVK
ncbi:tetratricopeptide repeat protein [Hoylesella shahii]|nr:tetratricopeptide repeat protein [Hoylesella shahii]